MACKKHSVKLSEKQKKSAAKTRSKAKSTANKQLKKMGLK